MITIIFFFYNTLSFIFLYFSYLNLHSSNIAHRLKKLCNKLEYSSKIANRKFKEFYLFKNITKFKQGGKSDLFGSNLKRWFKYVQTPTHFASYHGKNYCLFIPLKSMYFFFYSKAYYTKVVYFYYFYSTFMDMVCFGEKLRSEGFSFCNKFELLTGNRTVFLFVSDLSPMTVEFIYQCLQITIVHCIN